MGFMIQKTKQKNRVGFTQPLSKKRGGFTLVELLVVISIIGILSSLSTVSVNIARQRARDAKRQADMAQIQLALYLYFDDNLRFPITDTMFPADAEDNWEAVLVPHLNGTETGTIYMFLVPPDPLNLDQYVYGYNSNGREFVLIFSLENGEFRELHGY